MKADATSSGSVEAAAETNTSTLKKLIIEATDLIHSSQDVLARLVAHESVKAASNAIEQTAGRGRRQERRRTDELSPDILDLIASCGERVRKTDSIRLRASAGQSQNGAVAV